MTQSLVLNGAIFDGTEYFENGTIVVDQAKGVIVDTGKKGEVDEPKGSKVISGEGITIIPGLIDAHMHFFGSKSYSLMEWVTTPESLTALRSVADLNRLLRAGYTAVRDLGSKAGTYLSQAVSEGVIDGPRIVSAGKSLAQTGGDDDPSILPLHIAQELSYSYYCDGPWECRKAVRKVLRDGAECVKVYASSSFAQGRGIVTQLTVEELKAIVEEAHKMKMKVAAHAYGEVAMGNVVEASVDSIEHGIGVTAEIAAGMKQKGIFYVPTLSAFLAAKKSANAEREAYIQRHLTKDMELAKEYGVKFTSGSDYVGADTEPHGENYKEVINMAKYIGAKEALVAATSTAAQCLGLETHGHLKPKFEANIAVVKGNPIKKPEVLASGILHVVRRGKLFSFNE